MGMDMNKLLQQVEQMQGQMQKAQDELANETVEATAGGGMVTVKANGAGEIQQIKIDPKAIDPNDPEMLEDMILAAVNEAIRSAQSLVEAKLGPLAGGALGGLVVGGHQGDRVLGAELLPPHLRDPSGMRMAQRRLGRGGIAEPVEQRAPLARRPPQHSVDESMPATAGLAREVDRFGHGGMVGDTVHEQQLIRADAQRRHAPDKLPLKWVRNVAVNDESLGGDARLAVVDRASLHGGFDGARVCARHDDKWIAAAQFENCFLDPLAGRTCHTLAGGDAARQSHRLNTSVRDQLGRGSRRHFEYGDRGSGLPLDTEGRNAGSGDAPGRQRKRSLRHQQRRLARPRSSPR